VLRIPCCDHPIVDLIAEYHQLNPKRHEFTLVADFDDISKRVRATVGIQEPVDDIAEALIRSSGAVEFS